jgi:hypothetical protein
MMAGVTGKVIALVCAALVALPVSGHRLAYCQQSPHSDSSALAVAGIGGGTVLALLKALRFAPTLPGVFGGLDQGCARRDRAAWATADGCYAVGYGSGWDGQKVGLAPPGRHTSVLPKTSDGLAGQLLPDEPVNVLDPNGGDYEVSWHRRSCTGNCLVLARLERDHR